MSSDHPNFILLIGEDTGRHLGCYGDPNGRTPHLDRLAAEGCRYDLAFSTAPVCAPSRSCLVTGRYAYSIGSHHMRSTLKRPPRLFTQELRDAGYFVNWWTKTDFNFDPPADFADDASDWTEPLRQGALPNQPFFLYRNFAVTHESTMWAEPTSEGDRGAGAERESLEAQLPSDQRARPEDMIVPSYLPDTPEVRADLARYYTALMLQDRQVGEVLDALADSPFADSTVVIYLSDHGRGLVREKRWCYDAGVHLPLIVRGASAGGGREGQLRPGAVSQELVSWVDLAPTVLSLAGVKIPEQYQGQAFLEPGGQPVGAPRTYVFGGRDRMDEIYDRVRFCREKRFHYIRNFWPALPYAQRNRYMEHQQTTRQLRELHARGELSQQAAQWMAPAKPEEELYNAEDDPDMVHNLADDPNHEDELKHLRRALDAHLRDVDDLGKVSERELVDRGLVEDQIESYRQRVEPLPERYRIGPEQTLVEMHEAQAWTEDADAGR